MTTPDRPQRRRSLLNFLLVFVLGVFVARLPQTVASVSGMLGLGAVDGLTLIADVRRLLKHSAVEPPDDQKLTIGAINGMLESLDDPYAEFIPPDDAADFEKAMTGAFSGIGAQVEVRDGWLHVVSPLEDTPAYAAGVLAGDRITKIDGESTFGLTADQCIKKITGPEGTTVTITISRPHAHAAAHATVGTAPGDPSAQTTLNQTGEFDLTITRAKIVSKSVRGFRRLPDGTGHWDHVIDPTRRVVYVRMSQFTPTSPQELADALDQAQTDIKAAGGADIGGLILDLRSNPGGLMDAAIAICDLFLDSGTIMSTRGRNVPDVIFKANPQQGTPTFPIAVLVNGASASASEIVAGALSENNRAIVIGTRTFGKGLVQTVRPLDADGRAQLKFTAQRYSLPSGRLIQRTDESAVWGVDPSPGFYVPMTDAQTIAWILKRRSWDILRRTSDPSGAPNADEPPSIAQQRWSDPSWIEETAKDRQLAAAIHAVQSKLDSGAWPSGGEDPPAQTARIQSDELKALERARDRMGREFARLEKRIDAVDAAAAAGRTPAPLPDFWAAALDLTGGTVQVRDKAGDLVAELSITGPDLERWLAFGDLEKRSPSGTPAEPMPQPKTP